MKRRLLIAAGVTTTAAAGGLAALVWAVGRREWLMDQIAGADQ